MRRGAKELVDCGQPKELFKTLLAGDCLWLPAAAEGFVDGDNAAIQIDFGLGLGVFRCQALTLSIEQYEEVHGAFAVANIGEIGSGGMLSSSVRKEEERVI